jgi:hypothetical protein
VIDFKIFNGAVSTAAVLRSRKRLRYFHKWGVSKDLEGGDHDLILMFNPRIRLKRLMEITKTKVKIVDNSVDRLAIRTGHLPYKRLDCYYVRFEVLTVVKMTMLFFWVVTPCRLVGRYQRFGGTCCLHLQPTKHCGSDVRFHCYVIFALKGRK